MDTLSILINIGILLLMAAILFWMQKKHISFSVRVFTALGLGILYGLILHLVYGAKSPVISTSVDWFNLMGNGYVELLQMIVMPLVFLSILSAFTQLKLTQNIGKISAWIIGILLGTTAVAAGIGIAMADLFHLVGLQLAQGSTEATAISHLGEKLGQVQNLTFPQKILQLLPANPFLDFTGARPTSTIAIVIFAAILGIAYLGVKRKHPEQADGFARLVDIFYTLIMRVVTLVLRLTPYGVLALITKVAATSEYASIWKLGTFVVATYTALVLMFAVHLVLVSVGGLSPVTYVKKVFPVLTFAFTSRSSAATLPLNVETQTNELGVPTGIANLAGSFGISIGQNGCAGIYPAMLAVMIAPTVGINPFTPGFLVTLILTVTLSSLGVAGVGGGATFASLIVLSTLNLPVAIVGLLISVEPLVDMGRTALNVSGSMTAGVLTSRVLGERNREAQPRPKSFQQA